MKKKFKILISERRIKNKIKQLAAIINKDFPAKKPLHIIFISNGAMIFVADLARKITIPVILDSVSAYSYIGKKNSGQLKFTKKIKINIRGKNVLLVDDILDTGRTLSKIYNYLIKKKPVILKTCVLLDKPDSRIIDIKADYVGFTVPEKFLIGYGLDYNELYRNLPFIAIL
ncbi:MAG TPA: hypoxanthine phosphoribosyltransferase [Victivallales bacterium]|nr:hypoxanthine phosphoribosyltransferase [Victivallales bacterium]HPO90350.1 hypoxanthine phosphoribosyltransferase [Victivallales bacterium]HRR06493.1 hypoxanthine phosphoribosyltransferase [Victivallales bacterium]HRR28787.1 hypoxanthine phosphoribosyltransferase [Victivallales bacterium]HRU00717.1 hypoxanthine phosphoribosyltransferase [Victivallales bacterium]